MNISKVWHQFFILCMVVSHINANLSSVCHYRDLGSNKYKHQELHIIIKNYFHSFILQYTVNFIISAQSQSPKKTFIQTTQ